MPLFSLGERRPKLLGSHHYVAHDATLVGDAHTLEDPSQWGLPFNAEQVIAFTNSYWDEAAAPGRVGGTVMAADVDFS